MNQWSSQQTSNYDRDNVKDFEKSLMNGKDILR